MSDLPASRPTVLILGANGRLGCAAAQAFVAAGWHVLAQVRRDPSAALPARADVLRLRLSEPSAVAAASVGASVVVHAVNPVYTRWDAEALPALRDGLAVAEKLRAHFMLPGNVYNFGDSMPALLREDTLPSPTTRKGEIRVEMETQMAQRAMSGGFAASVVRSGDFFGSGTGSWLDLVIAKSLRSGRLVYPGPLNRPHAWAYLPDLARAFVRIAVRPPPPVLATWNFQGHTLTGAELLNAVEAAATELGVSPGQTYRHGTMPWGLIRAGSLFVPMWRELAQMEYLWRVPHALDGTRLAALRDVLQYETPLHVAMSDSLRLLGFGDTLVHKPAHSS